jgi:uncharacterized Zn finger protein
MCKHVAAVLYGIGARLDMSPELLFKLRDVDQADLVTNASRRMTKPDTAKLLEGENLSELFGIEIAEPKRKRGRTAK